MPALRFGDGTRKDRRKRGIGRFGRGITPILDIRSVSGWISGTWKNGADNTFHCYLDLDEIKTSGRQDVPEPSSTKVPGPVAECCSEHL